MKYYLKFLWVAVASGCLCILPYAIQVENFDLSYMVSMFGMIQGGCFVECLTDIIYWYLPLLFFQVFFGTYVYRHFCTASIYFFSRYTKRTSWYIKESGALFLMGILYLLTMLGSAIVCSALFTDIVIDAQFVETLFFYICIYSLFLFVSTLGINLIAILFNSNVGFMLVESMILICVAAFTMTGSLLLLQGYEIEEFEWLLQMNPFYYLVYSMKNETADYLVAIGVYLVMAVLVWIAGCVVINKRDFVGGNNEVGGM